MALELFVFLSKYVSRNVLYQMYKLYVRPHIDYGNVIYHNQSMPLSRKLESTQYKAALAVSGAWKGTNNDRLLEELGWETLSNRRWYRRLCLFYKIINNQAPHYLRIITFLRKITFNTIYGILFYLEKTCHAHFDSRKPFSHFALTRGTT